MLDEYFSGNKEAISILIQRHRKRIADYIYMMVKDREMADDTFSIFPYQGDTFPRRRPLHGERQVHVVGIAHRT